MPLFVRGEDLRDRCIRGYALSAGDPLEPARTLVSDLRIKAAEFPQSRKRDIALYGVLAGALRLVQILHRDDLLARAHELLPRGKHLKSDSDVYTLAAKLVFEERCLAWRASFCLRGLGMAQVQPDRAVDYLKENGGMNTFSAERRRHLELITSRTLRLDKSIVVARGSTITVTLRHDKDSNFVVVDTV